MMPFLLLSPSLFIYLFNNLKILDNIYTMNTFTTYSHGFGTVDAQLFSTDLSPQVAL